MTSTLLQVINNSSLRLQASLCCVIPQPHLLRGLCALRCGEFGQLLGEERPEEEAGAASDKVGIIV